MLPRVRAPAREVPRARRGGRGGALGALGGEQVRPGPASGGADVSAARGHGRAQADALPGLPAEGQGKGIEVAAADGARRAADVVAERLPDAELAAGPTRVAGWAAGAPGGPGRDAWRQAPREGR